MVTTVASSVHPLSSNHDLYDDFISDAVLNAVLNNGDVTKALLTASGRNPSKNQDKLFKAIGKALPDLLPEAKETYTTTVIPGSPYDNVKRAFDHIVATYTDLADAVRGVNSTISHAFKARREAGGDFSFSEHIQRLVVWRTTGAPYRYILPAGDFNNPPNSHAIFDAIYEVPFTKIKEPLTPAEYVNVFMSSYQDGFYYNYKEWQDPSGTLYVPDSLGNIQVQLGGIFDPVITVTGYRPNDIWTFFEYMVVVDSYTNCVRKVFAYNHNRGFPRISVLDNILEPPREVTTGDGDPPLTDKFYPVLPLRRNNARVNIPELNKIFKRNYDFDLPELIDNLEDQRDSAGNKTIGKIDDAYLVHGIPLNSRKLQHKEYLFQFFRYYHTISSEMKLRVGSQGYTIELQADSFGLTTDTYNEALGKDISVTVTSNNALRISKNVSDTHNETVNLVNFRHVQIIQGKTIVITARSALADQQYDEFLIPIHAPTIKNEIHSKTQMSIAGSNLYLVFVYIEDNQIRSTWQSFLTVFLIAIAVASVLVPFLAPVSQGILGANVAVGTALGLSGVAAGVVGTAVNLVVAGVLIKGIQELGSEAFGEEVGAVLAIISSVVIGSISSKGGVGTYWKSLSKINKVGIITDALTDLYTIKNNQELATIRENSKFLSEQTRKQNEENDERNKRFNKTSRLFFEKPESYLARTRFVGSDIVKLSLDSIENYVDNSLKLGIIT